MYEQTHVKTHEKRQGREPHLREMRFSKVMREMRSCQKVGANSREGLFRVNALLERSRNVCIVYILSSENQNVLLNVKSVLA